MAMVHIDSLFWKGDEQSYSFARFNKNTIFQPLFIRSWFPSITRYDFELSTMNMEWMYHSPHFVWLVINFLYFWDSFLLPQVNPFRIEFLAVDGDLIHHSKQFNLLGNRQGFLFFCKEGSVIGPRYGFHFSRSAVDIQIKR